MVKDRVLAEERAAIHAKGIAKPSTQLCSHRVDDLIAQGRAIHEERNGLRVFVDLQKLDKS